MIKKTILNILSMLVCAEISAQTNMLIITKQNDHLTIPLEHIEYITFVDRSDTIADETDLSGSWLWGDQEAGYYEVLTFNDDKTYTGYDNYFEYGFDTMTYGWYMLHGTLLTMRSSGFGYNQRYNWYIIGLSNNALDVMTKMGRFTYYRLQPEILHLQISGKPLECDEGDSFLFADGIVASIVKGKIEGLTKGYTYILKYIKQTNIVVAYKVMVE